MKILSFPLKNKSDRLTEETFLRLNRACQRCLGVWPEDNFWKVFPITIFCLSSYFLTSLSQVKFVYTHNDNYKELLILITPAGSYFVSLLKVIGLMLKRKEIREIFSYFKNEWINETAKENLEVIYEFTRLSHKYGIFLFLTISSTWVFFIALTLIFNIRSAMLGAYARILPFPSDYPFDVTTSPNFEIAFVFISWGGFLSIFGIPTVDGSFIELNIHLAGQFRIVQTELKHMLRNETGNDNGRSIRGSNANFSKDELNHIHARLCKIAQKHIDAINMCDKIIKVYTPNIFMHFLTSALLVCMACVNFTIFSGLEKIKALFLSALVLTQLYLYCAGGTYIQEYNSIMSWWEICCFDVWNFPQSQGVSEAAYSVYWYKTDTRIKKVLQMIILRSQKGNVIRVPFFEVTASTFINILRTAGSYVSLFNALL